ncbi:MAG: alpha-amylase [Bacteroidales bacterium]|nr:alpha-amylase [Bacteroidales bacterium]
MKKLIYQTFPRLWGNLKERNGKFSNYDQRSLEYLRSLGIDYVWYTGVIRHACCDDSPEAIVKGRAGSPYAITDYFDVNPYLADDPSRRMEEFGELVSRTHGCGLKLIIDFVPNHVSRAYHSSFPGVRSLGDGDDCSVHWKAENDFYYYPGEELRLPVPAGEYREFPAKASGNAFTPSPSEGDWYETIRLNYCPWHTTTWDKMYGAVRFWALKGVDGFRCDMVEMVPPEFFKWLIARIKSEFPSVIFIAEVYETRKYRLYLEEVGFDLLYDKSGLYDTLRSICSSSSGAEGITRNWQMLGPLQGGMLNFLENHDEQRLASPFFAGSPEAAYAALAVSLLWNDAPFMLYFGQETGERGMDDEPFSGINGRTSIFDWWKVESLARLWNSIHGLEPGLTEEENAVLQRYRSILSLSKEKVFASGASYDLCYMQGPAFDRDRIFAWLRYDDTDCRLVLANFSDKDVTLDIELPGGYPFQRGITVTAHDYTVLAVK